MNRMKFLGSIFAFALLVLALPSVASAQFGGYGNDDYYGRNRNGNSNYNRRALVDAARRVENNSRSFRRALDRDLDDTRYNESRREDRINDTAERFATAADNLEDSLDSGRNLNNSSRRAQELLQLGSQLDRLVSRNRFSSRTENEWSQIRNDLRTIANAYGYNFNGSGRGNNRRDNDDDDDYRNRRNDDNRRRDNRNNRRFPF